MKKEEITKKIKIWNWTKAKPETKILEVTEKELQKWKEISTYGGDSYGTWSVNDKTWCEV